MAPVDNNIATSHLHALRMMLVRLMYSEVFRYTKGVNTLCISIEPTSFLSVYMPDTCSYFVVYWCLVNSEQILKSTYNVVHIACHMLCMGKVLVLYYYPGICLQHQSFNFSA